MVSRLPADQTPRSKQDLLYSTLLAISGSSNVGVTKLPDSMTPRSEQDLLYSIMLAAQNAGGFEIATQAEAEAGVENTKGMTALRVQQKITADLGAPTTVGKALLNLANPGAVTFLRVNADNTVTALSAAATATALGVAGFTGDARGFTKIGDFGPQDGNLALTSDGAYQIKIGNNAVCFRSKVATSASDPAIYSSWGIGFAPGYANTPTNFLMHGGTTGLWILGLTHATTATHQTIRAHSVTSGAGPNLILSGGNGSSSNGVVIISKLPTTNPGPGILWNNGGNPAIGT